MGLFDKLFNKKQEKVKETKEPPKPKKPRKPKEPKVILTDKEKATQAGEPYVQILSVEVDPNNVQNGAFELDWNSLFITQLVKAGYMKKKEDTDREIVDRWFTDVCRTVVLEMYEQQQADPENRDLRTVRTRDLGNGRTEVS